MAKIKDAKHSLAPAGQYLTFFTAGEEYAFAILQVKEIIEFSMMTVVPNTPAWVRGVTNLRGSVVPVIDLAVKFGLPPSQITKLSCVVVTEVMCEGEKLTMGVLADSVSQVMDFSAGDIEPAPPFGTRVKIEFLLGMGRIGNKFCLILDIDKVLSTDELLSVAEASESAQQGSATNEVGVRANAARAEA